MRCHPKDYNFRVPSFLQRWKGIIRNIYSPEAKDCLIPLQIVHNKSVNKTHEDSTVQHIVFKAL